MPRVLFSTLFLLLFQLESIAFQGDANAQSVQTLFQSESIPELHLESTIQDAERFLNWRIHNNSTGFSNQTQVSTEPIKGELPSQFTLYPNYPNPFNPETTIRFSLPSMQSVEFKVFTLTGQLVMKKSFEKLPSGQHRIPMNFSTLPTGVYLYRLSTPSEGRSAYFSLIK